MSDHDHRRVEDTPFGKIIYFWPLVIGACTLLLSIGGYVATIHYIGDRIQTIEAWISNQAKGSEERNTILSRLTTLQEVTNERLTSLEEWRNGVDHWNRKK